MECYDTVTKTWSKAADMNIARRGHGLVSLQGRLYAIGGLGAADSILDSLEVYDPDIDTWTLLQQKIDAKVAHHGACLVIKSFLKVTKNIIIK